MAGAVPVGLPVGILVGVAMMGVALLPAGIVGLLLAAAVGVPGAGAVIVGTGDSPAAV